MLSGKILLCAVVIAAWSEVQPASLPLFKLTRIGDKDGDDEEISIPPELGRVRVGEGLPIPLCAGRCDSPPEGPVCAFDAKGTARTFATICELEAAWCHESIYYAVTSLGEC